MSAERAVLGVDGCRSGWVCCLHEPTDGIRFSLVRHTMDLMPLIERCALTCIDIPIGIPHCGERACDLRAKSILGRWHARVFMTPPRSVLACERYEDANSASRHTLGKGLSKQAWNILPKVRSIDGLLGERPELIGRVHECHPEIALWGMTQRVIESRKSTALGALERLDILRAHFNDPPGVLAEGRRTIPVRDAKDDDLIDAMICAATSAGNLDQSLHFLDTDHPVDERGIPMNMVYRRLA